MRTVLKLRASDGPNALISTTLGKLAVIDRMWRSPQGGDTPKGDEFWLVDVVKEMQPGKAKGAFLIHPLRCVARILHDGPDGRLDRPLLSLLPGMYTIEMVTPGPLLRPVAIVTPEEHDGRDWTISLDAAKIINSICNDQGQRSYAVVVNLGGEMWRHVRQHAREGNGIPYAEE